MVTYLQAAYTVDIVFVFKIGLILFYVLPTEKCKFHCSLRSSPATSSRVKEIYLHAMARIRIYQANIAHEWFGRFFNILKYFFFLYSFHSWLYVKQTYFLTIRTTSVFDITLYFRTYKETRFTSLIKTRFLSKK